MQLKRKPQLVISVVKFDEVLVAKAALVYSHSVIGFHNCLAEVLLDES